MSISNYDVLTMDELQRLGSSGDMLAVQALGRRTKIDEYCEEINRIDASLDKLLKLTLSGSPYYTVRDELEQMQTYVEKLKNLFRS